MRQHAQLIRCFKKAGVMFFDKNSYDPCDLLKGKAHKFKNAIQSSPLNGNARLMECVIAELFMFIKQCQQNYLKNNKKRSPQGIIKNSYGSCFSNLIFFD